MATTVLPVTLGEPLTRRILRGTEGVEGGVLDVAAVGVVGITAV